MLRTLYSALFQNTPSLEVKVARRMMGWCPCAWGYVAQHNMRRTYRSQDIEYIQAAAQQRPTWSPSREPAPIVTSPLWSRQRRRSRLPRSTGHPIVPPLHVGVFCKGRKSVAPDTWGPETAGLIKLYLVRFRMKRATNCYSTATHGNTDWAGEYST